METQQTNTELTPKQIAGLEALLTCPTQEKAALKANVDASTLRRWMKEPAFSQAYKEARTVLVDSTLTGLQAISAEAVQSLYTEMSNGLAKPAERISAARAILEFALKTQDALETDQRLSAIELALTTIKEARKQ